jgi:solute carrier family 25 protein 34/35
MEVMKTRLQLDGELQSRARVAAVPEGAAALPKVVVPNGLGVGPSGRVYTNAWDCAKKTWKFEGVRGVQRGLGAAVSRG